MTRRNVATARSVGITLSILLAATACSNSGGKGEDTTPSEGPLDAFYSAIYGSDTDFDAEELRAQEQKREDLVAECMKGEGFDYIPYVEPTTAYESPTTEGDVEWGTVAYAEKYGYGVATTIEYGEIESGSSDGNESTNPNDAIVAAMSESEMNAYYGALYGPSIESDPADWDDEGNWIGEGEPPGSTWQEQGCYGAAAHELGEDESSTDGLWEDPVYQEIEAASNEAYENLPNDPKMAEALNKWRSCMAEADYDFETPDAAHESVFNAMNEYYEQTDAQTAEALREEIAANEIALATADMKCQESVNFVHVRDQAIYDIQAKIADEYADELADLVERYGTEQ